MKSLFFLALFCVGSASLFAAPSVSNVRASQRAGTNLVDVYYNLSGSGQNGSSISVELSDNGGTSYGLPISTLSGHVGNGITDGANRHLVWDAGADRPGNFSATMRLRLSAVDTPPPPTGFALIPAGSFQMGRTSGDTDSEAPPVNVYVSTFYIAKHETTKELWDEVRAWAVNNGYTDLPTGGAKATNHPVHSINWFAMIKWCNARSQKEGLTPVYSVIGEVMKTGSSVPIPNWNANGYRLPTEAEWEKASRGGLSGKRFPWGDTITHSHANYNSSTSYAYDISPTSGYHPTYSDGTTPHTSPVGSFAPNGYGLFDMAGNLWERCWDWYGPYIDNSIDPRGKSTGSGRIYRGGHWSYDASICRASKRGNAYVNFGPSAATNTIGFRVARSSVP